MDEYAKMIQQSVAQNNAWSAQQAERQMEFQERMSSTAIQRQVADLKAAGVNPVLSAKLGGASTPTGAMGDTDTGLTGALVDLLQMSIETANAAAGAAYSAASSSGEGLLGLPLIKNPRQPWQIAYNWLVSDEKVKNLGEKAADKLTNGIAAVLNSSASAIGKGADWLEKVNNDNLFNEMAPAYGKNGRHTKGGQQSKKETENAKSFVKSVNGILKFFR